MASVAAASVELPLVLSLDVGSSSVRAVLFDARGREVPETTAQTWTELATTIQGAATADPDGLLETIFGCIDRVLTKAGPLARHVAGVGVSTFVGNLMGIDASGRPETPLVAYADTRANEAAAELRRDLDEDAFRQRTGCRFHSSYAPAQLVRLRRDEPGAFARVARWITLGEYLEHTLFGACAVSNSVAAWSGLLDVRACAWDAPLLEALGLDPARLSPVHDVSEPRSGLAPAFAARWPALASVPWFPAIGDGAAANVGSGCMGPDTVALSMGTSSAMRIAVPQLEAPIPDGLWCYRIDREHLLLGGALSEGGNVYEWMQTRLAGTPDQALRDATRLPDAHGLTVLPFLAGERSPGWAGHARATIHGLTLATRPEDILAASLEAVAYRLGMVYDRLSSMTHGAVRIVASGGALAASPVWLGIIADVLGAEVALAPTSEASARGAALMALDGLGVLAAADLAPEVAAVYEPDPARHEVYRAAKARQHELYTLLVSGGGRPSGEDA